MIPEYVMRMWMRQRMNRYRLQRRLAELRRHTTLT